MYTILHTINKIYNANSSIILQTRLRSKTHWAKLRKKTSPKYKALNHFDDFYGSVFGNKWETMREGLLRRPKYVALVNNYGDTDETVEYLANRGAHCLRNLMSIQEQFQKENYPVKETLEISNTHNPLNSYISRLQSEEISSLYPQGAVVPDKLEMADNKTLVNHETNQLEKIVLSSPVEQNQATNEFQLDESRIINASMGLSSEALYQYVPATKLKGMDDWVPESLHYSFYTNTNADFPLLIEPETDFKFPEHLKVMTYEINSDYTKFPEPKRSKTGVFNYYPMDGGSILPVLALCLSPGDRMLDLCAAPGGKSLAALQTLLPDVLVCNDLSISRMNRLRRIFRDYLMDYEVSNKWRDRVVISQYDGRHFTDDQGFDKVLVDVPCTTDRHSVMEDENNIFRPDRVKERLRIPELQSQLLFRGLQLVRVGGAVVYSSCSLSPVQNDGVVHAALRLAAQDGIFAAVRDLSQPFSSLCGMLHLGSGPAKPKYGELVTPNVSANFGPSYIARLVRVK